VGFFPCNRGVCQGDPLSPLLFCLAEEALSRALEMERCANALQPMSYCRGVSLPTHILYADDVFICCVGSKKNIRCLLKVFTAYSEISGQLVNFDKSKIFTGAMTVTRRNMLAQLSGFTVGNIPFQYLGCPIFQGRPKCIHFQYIVDRIKVKLSTWKGVLLSIMGRVQLVKSMVHGMLVYSFHIYRWPARLLTMLDRWINNFIWSGDINTRKICTVAWSKVCLPWDVGGLDLKSTRHINDSLLLHFSWKLFTQNSQCSLLFQARFLSFGLPRNRYFKSSVWPGVKDNLNIVAANSRWIIGNGESISVWFDNWLGDTLAALLDLHPQVFPRLKATLASVIADGKWQIPRFIYGYPQVASQIMQITLSVSPLLDKLVWIHASDGLLFAMLASLFLLPSPNTLDWASTIWRPCIPASHSFVFWRLMLSKIPMDEKMKARGCTLVSVCLLCYKHAESSTQLFLECDFARNIWIWLGLKLKRSISLVSFAALLECVPQQCSSQIRDVMVAAVVHTVYSIWLARNALRFNSTKVSIHATLAKISSFLSMSGTISKGHCVASDVDILNNLFITPTHIRIRDIILVVWKAPTSTWVKANTDGSVRNTMAACGGIFRDCRGTFLGGFASNIGGGSVFDAEILGLILAM